LSHGVLRPDPGSAGSQLAACLRPPVGKLSPTSGGRRLEWNETRTKLRRSPK
jgi:hypothetical protein